MNLGVGHVSVRNGVPACKLLGRETHCEKARPESTRKVSCKVKGFGKASGPNRPFGSVQLQAYAANLIILKTVATLAMPNGCF